MQESVPRPPGARWRAGSGALASLQSGQAAYENDYVKENGVWKLKKLHGPLTYPSYYAEPFGRDVQ